MKTLYKLIKFPRKNVGTENFPRVLNKPLLGGRDENGTNIFRLYSRPNPFRDVLIRPYPSPDI
jgi:hypothetical protein